MNSTSTKPPADDVAVAPATASATSSTSGTLNGSARAYPDRPRPGWLTRTVMGLLLTLVAVAVAVIIVAPLALSSHDLLGWAASPTGLRLPARWNVLVILALDAPAIVSVLMSVVCTWRGERPGIFAFLVWGFAVVSAFANWRHSTTPGSAPDSGWFIPLMSLSGPGTLDVVLHRVRPWMQPIGAATSIRALKTTTRAATVQQWIPGIGSFRDTLGTHRTRILLDLDSRADAAAEYHQLCPDGSLRVAAALRRQRLAEHYYRLRNLPGTDPGSASKPAIHKDLLNRIPLDDKKYQIWRDTWRELSARETTTGAALDNAALKVFADTHDMSLRQLQFIANAGKAGLLDNPVTPLWRLIRREQTTSTASPAA